MSEEVELMLLADIRSLEITLVRITKQRDEARAKAADFERDWYAAKSEFGTAMAKMREALRAAEGRELEALEELDEATAILVAVAKLLMANGCDCECGHDSEGHDDDCERCFACKVSDAIGSIDEGGSRAYERIP